MRRRVAAGAPEIGETCPTMTTDTLDNPMRFGSGRAVKRIEDEGLLKGLGQYTDDLAPAGQLRACG